MSRWWNRVRHTPVLEELAAGLLDEVAEADTNEDDGSLETISSDISWRTGELMTLSSDTFIKKFDYIFVLRMLEISAVM